MSAKKMYIYIYIYIYNTETKYFIMEVLKHKYSKETAWLFNTSKILSITWDKQKHSFD